MEERFETFTILINRISRNIRKIKNQEMAACNLRSAHISCLYYLESNGFYRYLSAISRQLEVFADTCEKTNLPDVSSGHQKIGDSI